MFAEIGPPPPTLLNKNMPVLKVRPRDILTHGLSEIMKYEALILSLCLISFAHKSYVDLYILSFKSVLLIEPIL